MYVLGGRIYCPALRRFLSVDPVSPMRAGGMNRYAYCGGDPIQRIDPGGNAWLDWLSSGLGLLGAIAGTVMSAIALVGSGGLATPAIVALGAALALDAVSVVAEAGSIIGLATDDSGMGKVMGWVAFGSGLASAGAAVTSRVARSAARVAALSGDGASQSGTSARSVSRQVRKLDEVDESRLRRQHWPHGKAWKKVRPVWHELRSDDIDGAIHFGVDTQISARKVMKFALSTRVDAPVASDVFLYAGAHGDRYGRNWNAISRRKPARQGWRDMSIAARGIEDTTGFEIQLQDLSRMSREKALADWCRPGIHIHGYCFGAVDELLLTLLRKSEAVPVYV